MGAIMNKETDEESGHNGSLIKSFIAFYLLLDM